MKHLKPSFLNYSIILTKKGSFVQSKITMMWKCFGPMAEQHTRCYNDRDTHCGDQVSLLGWDSADYTEQRNPAYKEATQVRKQYEIPRSQNLFRLQGTVQSSVPPAEVADTWTPYEPSTNMSDESKKTKEATISLTACPPNHVNKSGDFPPRQRIRPLLRLNNSFENASTKECRKKQVLSRRASMSLVDENNNRSLRNRGSSCRSLYLGMTDKYKGEPGMASNAPSAKVNDASPSVLSNQSFGDGVVIPGKRGSPKASKSLNEKKSLVENRIPRLARKILYLQLEIYHACDIVEGDAESGWAFKTPTTIIVEIGPQPPVSAPTHLRAVWCLV